MAIKASGIKCQFCGKECNTSILYLHRYAHSTCAERAYLATPDGVHGLEEWWERPTEERYAELNAATGPKYT